MAASRMLIVLAFALISSACGSEDPAPTASEVSSAGPTSPTGDGGGNCDRVIDRWLEIQQDLLDQLAAAESDGLSDSQRTAIFSGTASAIFENGRDAITLGCEAALETGSDEICERVTDLVADPGVASDTLDRLLEACAGA